MTQAYHTTARLYSENSACTPWQKGGAVSLSRDQLHYLRTVLRYNVGDKVRLFDGYHGEWLATVDSLGKKQGLVILHTQIRPQPLLQQKVQIHIAFAPLKKNAHDMAVEKSVELGIDSLTLVQTDRTNVHMASLKQNKINARMIQACQQCERLSIPEFRGGIPFAHAIESLPMPILYCAEWGKAKPLAQVIQSLGIHPSSLAKQSITILVGPEGGFTPTEFAQLQNCPHAHCVSLGPRILRAETAIIASLSVVQSMAGDWRDPPPR